MSDPTVPLTVAEIEARVRDVHPIAQRIRDEVGRVVVGQARMVDRLLMGLLCDGHVLLEGVPGLAKTLTVRSLAQALRLDFQRVQFTPDLLPADVIGTQIYNPRTQDFTTHTGPVFANIVLADEINRAPAKVQSALLEAMQERQVTIADQTHALPSPFLVLATQNPIEQEGTYPLPEAQLDRFLLKVRMEYPPQTVEVDVVKAVVAGAVGNRLDVERVGQVVDTAGARALQQATAKVTVDDRVVDYAVRIVRATRGRPGLAIGAGPRGAISLVRVGRAMALLEGRDFVTPDDIQQVARPVLRHRIQLSADAEIEGQTPETALARLLDQVEAPRQ
jgi:MoxR-like ATPase